MERFQEQRTTPETGAFEEMMLGLRRINEGVDLDLARGRWGEGPVSRIIRQIGSLSDMGLLIREGSRVRLSARGIRLADEVLAEFV